MLLGNKPCYYRTKIAERRPTDMQNGVSIIICCYNSEKRIAETLRCLAAQTLADTDVEAELLLVDNNCTDHTVPVARDTWQQAGAPFPLYILRENTPGLTYARKKGIASARYSQVLFCDDDNHLAPDYLQTGYHFMQAHPQVGACGGYSYPVFEAAAPGWIQPFLEAYAIGPDQLREGEIHPPRVPWGAGLWMPAAILKKISAENRPSRLADRTGKSLSSGGDTELCYRVHEAGYTWYFLPALRFGHVVPAERMNRKYLRRLYLKFGEAEARIALYYNPGGRRKTGFNIARYLHREKWKLRLWPFLYPGNSRFAAELERIRIFGYYSEWLKLHEDPAH